jgi:hypothetical protein
MLENLDLSRVPRLKQYLHPTEISRFAYSYEMMHREC